MTSSSVDSPGLASDLANLPRVQISKTTWIKGWLILPTFTLLTHLASQVSPGLTGLTSKVDGWHAEPFQRPLTEPSPGPLSPPARLDVIDQKSQPLWGHANGPSPISNALHETPCMAFMHPL